MNRVPHSKAAERAFLGAILVGGNDTFDQAAIQPDQLFCPQHRIVYEAMQRLRGTERPVNDESLLEVEIGDKLSAIGGLAFLAELALVNAASSSVAHYADEIRGQALTRSVKVALSELQASDLEGEALVGECLKQLGNVARVTRDNTVTIAQATKAFSEKYSAEGQGGLQTGIDDLDDILGGISRGNVTIVAGRPSHGKSALTRTIASNIAAAGLGVHVFTPEDTRITYAAREVSDRSGVHLDKLMRFDASAFNQQDIWDMGPAVAGLATGGLPWLLDDSSGISAQDVALRVRKHRPKNETALVVVDYVQKLTDPTIKRGDLRVQNTVAMQDLVTLARSEDVAVLLLSQLNRKCEERPNKRPIESDLREAGDLEQDAYAIVMVHREERYTDDPRDADGNSLKGISEIIVRKNKNGPVGACRMRWDAERATHRPLARGTM